MSRHHAVIPGRPAGVSPESIFTVVVMDSGLLAEFIIGPTEGRTRWLGPGMTEPV